MRFVDEYRNIDTVSILSQKIRSACLREWTIMEICGGQTHTIMKYGLEELLPDKIDIIHGPGCPVCVTPLEIIDKAINLALRDNVIIVSYGDMLRVPGSMKDLLYAKAEGADVRIIYSPIDAVKIAESERDKNVVFLAVGFETTAPANAMAVLHAKDKGLNNFFILSSHMIVLPAVELILSSQDSRIQGLLAPGHVCTVTGYGGFLDLSKKYRIPVAVTGFEPVDILQGILLVIEMLENKTGTLANQYSRSVKMEGNLHSQKVMEEVYEVADSLWRGIGIIPRSGLKLKDKYECFDAEKNFDLNSVQSRESDDCIAGEILQGIKKPGECKAFGKQCTPSKPLGAPMVSSEGACAAYFKYK